MQRNSYPNAFYLLFSLALIILASGCFRRGAVYFKPLRCPDFGGEGDLGSYLPDKSGAAAYKDYSGPGAADGTAIRAGTLTAGELNDLSKWEQWTDIAKSDLSLYRNSWKLFVSTGRYTVSVHNAMNRPVADAEVQLINSQGKAIFSARSDNAGRAELWTLKDSNSAEEHYSIQVNFNGNIQSLSQALPFEKGINYIQLPVDCTEPGTADIMWVVDATGSMSDEIEYLKTELQDVISRTKSVTGIPIRLGSVFYRDKGDQYVTRLSDFNENEQFTLDFIKDQKADGGGDFPEAVDKALDVALNKAHWSRNARTRILFLLLDAPPHSDAATVEYLQKLIIQSAEKGVRIIPVAASGIDKNTEFLLRSISLITNGNYLFLTDHSGVDNSHIAPSTDEYAVETLNNLLVRIIAQNCYMPGCESAVRLNAADTLIRDTVAFVKIIRGKDASDSISISDTVSSVSHPGSLPEPVQETDTVVQWKAWPNPCSGLLHLGFTGDFDVVYVSDVNGKLLLKQDVTGYREYTLDLGLFSSGIYIITVSRNGLIFRQKMRIYLQR